MIWSTRTGKNIWSPAGIEPMPYMSICIYICKILIGKWSTTENRHMQKISWKLRSFIIEIRTHDLKFNFIKCNRRVLTIWPCRKAFSLSCVNFMQFSGNMQLTLILNGHSKIFLKFFSLDDFDVYNPIVGSKSSQAACNRPVRNCWTWTTLH